MKKTLFAFIVSMTSLSSFAQHPANHCGSEYISQQMKANNPEFVKTQNELEEFTRNYVEQQRNSKKTRATVYKIPIVVHVIHNGESIGSGANVSVAQINSQIAVLNKDYRLLNTDSLKKTHAFWPVTDDCEITFCLASLDPSGKFTTGIDRVNGGQASYDYPELETSIKPSTIWDHTKYLNMWVCKFGGSASTLLGYATPPGASATNDGVVIGTTNFGNVGNVVAPYHKGRTATHEIGHYFNLRHIWGDALCGDDLVSDTAPAEQDNYGCPSFPYNANSSCGSNANGEMYMNYMDYTDDGCMVMFTTGQKNRMRATLTSGGSRSSLTSSLGCTWPVGITELSSELNVSIFPNPSIDYFYISNTAGFGDDFSIQLLNSIGQDVSSQISASKENSGRYYINSSALANGTYFVKVYSNSKSITKSLTIIK